MPIRYVCSRCGFVLYEYSRPRQDYKGILTPEEVWILHAGKCPRCGKPINTKPNVDDVTIEIVQVREQ